MGKGGRTALALLLAWVIVMAGCGGGDDRTSTTHAGSTPQRTHHTDKSSSKKSSSPKPRAKPESKGSRGKKPHTKKRSSPNRTNGPPKTAQGGVPVGTVPPGAGPAADRRAIVRTIRAYVRSIARGDGVQACAQLTRSGRRAIEREIARAAPETRGTPCEGSIQLYQSTYSDAARNPRVTDVRVAGDRATAAGPLDQTATLVKQDRLWLIARYA